MRRLPTLAALIVFACANAAAQSDDPAPGVPGPFDAFGDVYLSDLMARLDNFAIELQNDPASRGLIVIYPQPNRLPGWYLSRAYWARGYLLKNRGLDAARVEVVNGGYRDATKYELWALRPGAPAPVAPFDWAAALAREKSPVLFDRNVYEDTPPAAEAYEDYTDERDGYEPFVSALRADPAARGLIIAYTTRRAARGADRKLAAREKLSVMKLHAIGADRVVAIGGGVRRNRTVEFWIVPPGAELPKPSPAERPLRQRRRVR